MSRDGADRSSAGDERGPLETAATDDAPGPSSLIATGPPTSPSPTTSQLPTLSATGLHFTFSM